MVFHKIDKVHFVGIGGIGMSGIAEVLLNLGFKVTGSDLRTTETTERLQALGAKIFTGHKEENIGGADVVVVSSAVRPDNPEVQKAKELFVPVIQRAEMLAELMRIKYSIAVAGAHGKTTTTSLVSTILAHAGLDPTCVIGGRLNSLGSNAKLGGSKFLVAEADESDGTFLLLFPTIAVTTNIDLEHLDFYQDINEIKAAFLSFLNKVPFYGLDIICIDNANVQSLIPQLKRRYMTYGLSKQADLRAENISYDGFITSFKVLYKDKEMGDIVLALPGIHNVVNALAACGVAIELDIPFWKVREALESFGGIHRRLEMKWNGAIKLIDDYGHHPTEIKATLAAVRQMWKGRIVVVFQPHRYTRTKALMEEFATSFNEADVLIVTEIYAASEEKIEGVDGQGLSETIRASGHKNVMFAASKEDAAEVVLGMAREGDVVITLGAGDICRIEERLKAAWSGQG
ncbi:MAG TPA: UDP-N-acetylmuramate--L-alanine ligase [Syntrophorhabdus sp.]|nr:UDP-N-acetylmuramate--L-alanine ligase [Syntrophorhabdus sp.]HPW36721.1 UDP-N-acetylmuramate--L-alanine ligase [Syntrophorhabdus sp.]HQB34988.1 UDP-N-acetylmuramate--L-alanine ligase [Syntrophorhabdus sp.]